MLLNLPMAETPEDSELKRKVSPRTKNLAKSILKQLHRTAHSKTAFQVPKGNKILQHAPTTSRAYLPPQITSIPKKDTESTTPQADEKIPGMQPLTSQKPNKRDRAYTFDHKDELMITVQRIFSPQRYPQYLEWINNELPKEPDVPQSLVNFVKEHLPKKIVTTYKVIDGSQTNLRTDKNYVVQRTSNQGPMPAAEISIHRPMDLMENFYNFQELNILQAVQVDKAPMKEYIVKTSRPTATASSKSQAKHMDVRHNIILAVMPEETVVIPKERTPTPEPLTPKPPTPSEITAIKQNQRKRKREDQGKDSKPDPKRLQFIEVEPTETEKTTTTRIETEDSDSESSTLNDMMGFTEI